MQQQQQQLDLLQSLLSGKAASTFLLLSADCEMHAFGQLECLDRKVKLDCLQLAISTSIYILDENCLAFAPLFHLANDLLRNNNKSAVRCRIQLNAACIGPELLFAR